MEKADMSKLEVAIKYVERIAEGYNPVNNLPAEEDSVLNNPNVIRCMFFIKDVLEAVKRNDGVIGKQTGKNKRRPFPFEILNEFVYQEDKSISYLLKQIYEPIEKENFRKISAQTVTGWLKTAGYLLEEYNEVCQKVVTMPTKKGEDVGLYSEIRTYGSNTYAVIMYNQKAQEFVVKNLEAIVNGEVLE